MTEAEAMIARFMVHDGNSLTMTAEQKLHGGDINILTHHILCSGQLSVELI